MGALPMGALPIGALPTTGVGGGGWRVGISAAMAALANASVEAVTRIKCFIREASPCTQPFLPRAVTQPLTVALSTSSHLALLAGVYGPGNYDGLRPSSFRLTCVVFATDAT